MEATTLATIHALAIVLPAFGLMSYSLRKAYHDSKETETEAAPWQAQGLDNCRAETTAADTGEQCRLAANQGHGCGTRGEY